MGISGKGIAFHSFFFSFIFNLSLDPWEIPVLFLNNLIAKTQELQAPGGRRGFNCAGWKQLPS